MTGTEDIPDKDKENVNEELSEEEREEERDEVVEDKKYYDNRIVKSKNIRNSDRQIICREKFHTNSKLSSRSYYYDGTNHLKERQFFHESGFKWMTRTYFNQPGKKVMTVTILSKDVFTIKTYDPEGRLHGYGAWTERLSNGNLLKFVSYVHGVENNEEYTWGSEW